MQHWPTWSLAVTVWVAVAGCAERHVSSRVDGGRNDPGWGLDAAARDGGEGVDAAADDSSAAVHSDAGLDAGEVADAAPTRPDAGALAPIGDACDVDDDCLTGECDRTWFGGYCTRRCSMPGEVDVCGEGAICSNLCAAEALLLKCFRVCSQLEVPSSCRQNYECSSDALRTSTVCRPADCDRSDDCIRPGVECYDEVCGFMCLPP